MIKLKQLLLEDLKVRSDGGLEISSPDLITDDQWNKIAKLIHQKGYNIYDGPDAKRAVTNFLIRRNGVLEQDGGFLSDWISSIKMVTGLAKRTPSAPDANAKKVITTAKRVLGTTNNLKLAGYILPDGSLLRLSHEGYTRDLDHREILAVFQKLGIEVKRDEYQSGTPYMNEFIKMGAIRINGEHGQVELGAPPTGAQERILGVIFARNNGEIDLDVGDKDYGKDSQRYPEGTSPRAILSDINLFYRKGSLPKRSEFREDTGQIKLKELLFTKVKGLE